MVITAFFGLAVCVLCICVGAWAIKRGNRLGAFSIMGGILLSGFWLARLAAAVFGVAAT
jgi:hypothetical protein